MDGVSSWWEFVSERPEEIWELTLEHAYLVLSSLLVATAISVVLGVLAHRHRLLRAPFLGVAGVFLTIPSFALFALFIPIVGLGNRPAQIALVMYSILPILRNTVTGLAGVDTAIVESAKGMGLSATQRLVRVELPMAWPVILAGIRVATLLATGIAAIATLVGGGGLGEYIKEGLTRYPLPSSVERIWVGTVFTVLLALVLDFVFSLVQRLTTSKGLTR
jgi:osmoprotectant transport system permease protein